MIGESTAVRRNWQAIRGSSRADEGLFSTERLHQDQGARHRCWRGGEGYTKRVSVVFVFGCVGFSVVFVFTQNPNQVERKKKTQSNKPPHPPPFSHPSMPYRRVPRIWGWRRQKHGDDSRLSWSPVSGRPHSGHFFPSSSQRYPEFCLQCEAKPNDGGAEAIRNSLSDATAHQEVSVFVALMKKGRDRRGATCEVHDRQLLYASYSADSPRTAIALRATGHYSG